VVAPSVRERSTPKSTPGGTRPAGAAGQTHRQPLSRRGSLRLGAAALGLLAPPLASCGAGGGATSAGSVAGGTGSASLSGRVGMYFFDGEPLCGSRQRAMAPFSQKFPGAQLDVSCVASPSGYFGDYVQRLQAMMISGAGPDVYIVNDLDLQSFFDRKQLLNVEPLVKRDKYDLADFPKAAIEFYRENGKGLFGLPDNLASFAIYYNVELLSRLGAKTPPSAPSDKAWTLEAMRDAAQKLTRRDEDPPIVGFQPATTLQALLSYVHRFGGDVVSKDGTQITVQEEPGLRALQFLADLQTKQRVQPEPDDLKGMSALDLFVAGRLGMHEALANNILTLRERATFTWDVGFIPSGPAGEVNHLWSFPIVAWRETKAPDLAWEVIKYFEDEAMPVIVRDGNLQGSKMNAHQRKYLVDPSKPPKHAEVFVTSTERFAQPPPRIRNASAFQTAWTEEIGPVLKGQRTPRDGALALKQRLDPLLKAPVA
jgi:ABC-type glycerol-3-phosphate transport system substrate-binding protein